MSNEYANMDSQEIEAEINAIIKEYESRVEELEDEIRQLGDVVDAAESYAQECENLMETSISLKCPICSKPIRDDIIYGLICSGCRRVFELKEKLL